jgi:hypothetical protein
MRQHHDRRPPARLGSRHERWLYVASAGLLVSGLGWLVGHYLLSGSSPAVAFKFGADPQPSEIWWLRVHGAAMMGFLLVFGALLPGHVPHGWRGRQNRRSGILVIAVVIALGLTGYGLYYLGDESTRPWISATHWALGLVAVAALLPHVILGKRGAQRIKSRGSRSDQGRERRNAPTQSKGQDRAAP